MFDCGFILQSRRSVPLLARREELGRGGLCSPRIQALSHTSTCWRTAVGYLPEEAGARPAHAENRVENHRRAFNRISVQCIYPGRSGCSTLAQGLGRSLIWECLALDPGSGTAGYPSQGSILYRRPKGGRTAIGAMLVGVARLQCRRPRASPTHSQIRLLAH